MPAPHTTTPITKGSGGFRAAGSTSRKIAWLVGGARRRARCSNWRRHWPCGHMGRRRHCDVHRDHGGGDDETQRVNMSSSSTRYSLTTRFDWNLELGTENWSDLCHY